MSAQGSVPLPTTTPEAPPATEPTAEEEAEPPAGIKYDKGFILSSGDEKFELKTNLRSQIRLEVTRPDASEEFIAAFVVPRLRLQFEGFAYGKANGYKVEFDMANK